MKAVGTVPLPGFLVKPVSSIGCNVCCVTGVHFVILLKDLETATISLLHESIERDFVIHESFKLDNPTDLEK